MTIAKHIQDAIDAGRLEYRHRQHALDCERKAAAEANRPIIAERQALAATWAMQVLPGLVREATAKGEHELCLGDASYVPDHGVQDDVYYRAKASQLLGLSLHLLSHSSGTQYTVVW